MRQRHVRAADRLEVANDGPSTTSCRKRSPMPPSTRTQASRKGGTKEPLSRSVAEYPAPRQHFLSTALEARRTLGRRQVLTSETGRGEPSTGGSFGAVRV